MSWDRFFLVNNYWTARELDGIDARIDRLRSFNTEMRVSSERVADLETQVGRLLLLVQSLAEACVRKGVLTREEISAVSRELDLLDGVADNALQPAEERRDVTPVEHLRRLEKQVQVSTEQFLGQLENGGGQANDTKPG